MLSICYICLSTDRSLRSLGEPLNSLHDELCDFSKEGNGSMCCSDCVYMLKKFHSFKEKCLRANKILKKWKDQNAKVKQELNELKKEMPPSSLGFNQTNNKIYFYQENSNQNHSMLYTHLTNPNINNSQSPIRTSNLDIFGSKIYITSNDNTNIELNKSISTEHQQENTNFDKNYDFKLEPNSENEFSDHEVKIEADELNNTDIVIVDRLRVKNDIDNDYSDNNITNDSDYEFNEKVMNKKSDSDDSSDDEILIKKCRRAPKSDVLQKCKKKVKVKKDVDLPLNELKKVKKDVDSKKKKVKRMKAAIKKPNIEAIKKELLIKFGNEELKDEDGNMIDKDSIIESLDKMHKYTLSKVERYCLGPNPFTPEAIQVLSLVQKRYGNQFSSVFTTVHLSTKELVVAEFNKRREHESFVTSDHKCTLCYRGFKYEKLLDYHVKEYHNPERPFLCQICQMRFKDASAVNKHIAAHKVVYKCKICPLVTNFRNVMETHYNQHNGVKHTCEICKAELNSKSGLNSHMNSVHPSRYICQLCARTFVSEFGVSQHKLRKHPKEEASEGPPTARCESCNITFVSNAVYQTHVNKSHTDKSSDYPHKRPKITRQPSKYFCRVCKKVEHSMGEMKAHFRTEHPTENTDNMCETSYKNLCHVCGKGYNTIRDLNEHKNLHTGAKPYACDKCPKSFHRRLSLRIHRERHFPPTRECQHCGKKFRSAANLNNHVKTHIGIRQFTCELCSKSFLHRGSLNAHVRGVHLRIRRERKHNKELVE